MDVKKIIDEAIQKARREFLGQLAAEPNPPAIDFDALEELQDMIAEARKPFPGEVLREYDESLSTVLFAAPPLSQQRRRPN